MGTTTYEAIPYPEGTDLVIQGDDAMQALAERVDLRIARWSGGSTTDATPVALANNAWTDIVFSVGLTVSDNVTASANTTLTYTGAGARWFLVSAGANIAVNGSQPNGYLRIVHSGGVAAELIHSDNYDNLNAAIPLLLNPADTIVIAAKANDGSGATGGAYDRAWLRMVAL